MTNCPITKNCESSSSRLKYVARIGHDLRLKKYKSDKQFSYSLEALCSNASAILPLVNANHCRPLGGVTESPYSCQVILPNKLPDIADQN